jgi:hypothetical protein
VCRTGGIGNLAIRSNGVSQADSTKRPAFRRTLKVFDIFKNSIVPSAGAFRGEDQRWLGDPFHPVTDDGVSSEMQDAILSYVEVL